MKRLFLFSCLCALFPLTMLAQLSGGFYNLNGYVYFVGQNVSGYSLENMTVKCVNAALGQQQSYTVEFLANGDSFSVGPENGWYWQPGEQLFVTYENGQSVYWVFQPVPVYNNPYDNSSSNSSSGNEMVIRERIRQLEWKLRDAEESLRKYEESNRKNPSISGGQLVSSQRRLVQTYRDQIQDLMRQLR